MVFLPSSLRVVDLLRANHVRNPVSHFILLYVALNSIQRSILPVQLKNKGIFAESLLNLLLVKLSKVTTSRLQFRKLNFFWKCDHKKAKKSISKIIFKEIKWLFILNLRYFEFFIFILRNLLVLLMGRSHQADGNVARVSNSLESMWSKTNF